MLAALSACRPLSLDLLALLSPRERVTLRKLRDAGADPYFAAHALPVGFLQPGETDPATGAQVARATDRHGLTVSYDTAALVRPLA